MQKSGVVFGAVKHKAGDDRMSWRDAGNQKPQEAHEDIERRELRPQQHGGDNVHFRQEKNEQKETVGEQHQQVVQQQPDEVNRAHQREAVYQRQLHPDRQHSSSARSVLRLSQHPDCVDDIRKYCKGSNLNNFAAVECLQDEVEVSNITIIISISSSVIFVTLSLDIDICQLDCPLEIAVKLSYPTSHVL